MVTKFMPCGTPNKRNFAKPLDLASSLQSSRNLVMLKAKFQVKTIEHRRTLDLEPGKKEQVPLPTKIQIS
jgi:hypothetical protein